MTAYSNFTNGVLMDVEGCPDVMIEREVRNAAIEFCRLSLAWRKQLDPIQVFAEISQYTLDPPSEDSRVIKLLDVILTSSMGDVTELTAKTPQQLDAADSRWRNTDSNLNTNWYSQDEPGIIILAGMPKNTGSLSILAALAPTLTSTSMDDWIAEEYYEAILHGAKYRLMAVPQKPWSNMTLALWHSDKFNTSISEARISAGNAYQSNAPIRTTGYSK